MPRAWVASSVAGAGVLVALVTLQQRGMFSGSATKADPQPLAAQAPAPYIAPPVTITSGFSGVQGIVQLEWVVASTHYSATIHASGPAGYVDISFMDRKLGDLQIRENLLLQATDSGWRYQGSSPRVMPGEKSAQAFYAPDSFRLHEVGSGTWTFQDTCDSAGTCSPVQTMALQ